VIKTSWIINKLEEWAPSCLAEEWDNVGLLLGNDAQLVTKVLVALDATDSVIDEAIQGQFDLIITHHPLIYNPIKRITADNPLGRKLITLLKNGIGLYCAHTNLDKANGGVNDVLFERLDLLRKEPLLETFGESSSLGRVGTLHEKMTLESLAEYVKKALSLSNVRYAGDHSRLIHKVGICAGDANGDRYLKAAYDRGCDVYITGDLRYHGVQEALEMGLCLIDITHYAGEEPIIAAIVSYLNEKAGLENLALKVQATTTNGQVFVSK